MIARPHRDDAIVDVHARHEAMRPSNKTATESRASLCTSVAIPDSVLALHAGYTPLASYFEAAFVVI